MIDEVIENLYIGEAMDVLDESRIRRLTDRKITHVLTVSAQCIPTEKQIDGVSYMFIFALDTVLQDMFAGNLLANSLNYIRAAVENGGRILVHCEAGVSRSVFVVAAFLMQKYRWSAAEAVEYIKKIRLLAQPNDGFMQQLRIFESTNFDANAETITHCPLYEIWLHGATHHVPGTSQCDIVGRQKIPSDEAATRNVEYRCRKCGKILFFDNHIIKHEALTAETAANRAARVADCNFRYLLLPMKWMSLTDYQGKIFCPCGEKLGHYVWGGRICDGADGRSCGTAVRPWIHVNQNKVDRKVKADKAIASPTGIIVSRPSERVPQRTNEDTI